MKFSDSTEEDMIKITNKYMRKNNDRFCEDTFIEFLHREARKIPRRKREVILSENIANKIETSRPIKDIYYRMKNQQDVTQYLSKSAIKNKSSNDGMFNDWAISHFHLGNVFENKKSVRRTKDLLYAYITNQKAIFLDILPHREWGNQQLLKILYETDPQVMENYRLEGVYGLSRETSEDEYLKLRNSGTSNIIELYGNYFIPPGYGVNSKKGSLRITMFSDSIFSEISDIKNNLTNHPDQDPAWESMKYSIGTPINLGLHYYEGVFFIIDKNNGIILRGSPCIY